MSRTAPRVVNKHLNRYNRSVKARRIHGWRVTGSEAREIQDHLRGLVLRDGDAGEPRLVAGVDVSVTPGGVARGSVVVTTFPGLTAVETRLVEGRPGFPYVPGFLSFREAPLILAACELLTVVPDLILVDGQGVAHPRRIGLASHLGVLLDKPTIGCAKSRLCGEYGMPAREAGSFTDLKDNGEVIGAALRTRTGVSPVFVSVGHRIDLPGAIRRVLQCCRRYRLPEPIRLAHLASRLNLAEPVAI
jgi:deoxyribonuclease V